MSSHNGARRREAAAAEAATGKWFCSHGYHYASGPKRTLRGRNVCESCLRKVRQAKQARTGRAS